jgi:hypothetical protein
VPTDFCDQIGEARRVLRWLAGASDEIPVDCDKRGRFIGARDDYARTDDDIRQARDLAQRGLGASGLPEPMDPADARNPWRWDPEWMNAAWLRGVRDLLDWVAGDRVNSPVCGRVTKLPPLYELEFEDEAADEVVKQGRPGGNPVNLGDHPPQYGEAIQATICWLRGEITTPPVGSDGRSPYMGDQ